MADIGWLSNQAHQIHSTFMSLFYVLVTLLLCLGVFVEYFKWPLGGVPSFSVLVGRVFIAAILLNTYPEVSNTIAEVSDALSKQLGGMNQFTEALAQLGQHLKSLTFSWVSVRDLITVLISFGTFFLLYFSIHVVEAFLLYAWTLLYVFSPLLIAFFVLPATASATKALYRTLLEMSCWKIVWSVLATLLWSTALSDINKPGYDVNFISSICYNLILAGSVLLTPIIVHSLASSGLAGMTQSVGAIGIGAATMRPMAALSGLKKGMSSEKATTNSTPDRHFSSSRAQTASTHPTRSKTAKRCLGSSAPTSSSTSKSLTPKKGLTKKAPVQKPSPLHPSAPHTDADAPRKETTLSEM